MEKRMCVSKKCAERISQAMEKANEFSLYNHLINEHQIGTRKMATKRDFAAHDAWKTIGQMEKDCMCRKKTILERLAL